MAPMTVAGALTCVADHLDDETNRRWTAAQLKLGLTACLSKCQMLYHEAGGDRLDLELSGTTSAVDGSIALTSIVPLMVKDVCVVVGAVTYRIPPKSSPRRGYVDAVARSLVITYAREYALSATTTDPLVGVGATAANTWSDFENWVCAETALLVAGKDLEAQRLQWLSDLSSTFKGSVFARPKVPTGMPWPRREWSPLNDWVQWQYKPSTTTLNTVRIAW